MIELGSHHSILFDGSSKPFLSHLLCSCCFACVGHPSSHLPRLCRGHSQSILLSDDDDRVGSTALWESHCRKRLGNHLWVWRQWQWQWERIRVLQGTHGALSLRSLQGNSYQQRSQNASLFLSSTRPSSYDSLHSISSHSLANAHIQHCSTIHIEDGLSDRSANIVFYHQPLDSLLPEHEEGIDSLPLNNPIGFYIQNPEVIAILDANAKSSKSDSDSDSDSDIIEPIEESDDDDIEIVEPVKRVAESEESDLPSKCCH